MPTMTLGRPGMWMDVDVRWCEQVGHVFFGIVLNWRPLKKLVGLLSHNTSNISGLGVPGVPACCSIHYPLIRGLHASHQLLSPSTAALLVRGRRGRCAFRVDLSDIWCRRTWLYLKTMEHLLWMVRNYVYISVILYIYIYICVCVMVCVFLLQVWGRVSVLNLGKGLWKSECESHSLEGEDEQYSKRQLPELSLSLSVIHVFCQSLLTFLGKDWTRLGSSWFRTTLHLVTQVTPHSPNSWSSFFMPSLMYPLVNQDNCMENHHVHLI